MTAGKMLKYLYSAAYCRLFVNEQSTSCSCSARLTGQYSQNSPRRDLKSEGVIHRPPRDAALPTKRIEIMINQGAVNSYKEMLTEKTIAKGLRVVLHSLQKKFKWIIIT